jgi:phage shock protein C
MDRRLLRNEHDKIIAGVSSGTAEYMQVDVTIIRLLFVLSTIFLFGTGILVYLVMWIVVPVNNDPAARFSKFNDYFKDPNKPSPFNPGPFNQGPSSSAGSQTGNTGSEYTSGTGTQPNWTSGFNQGSYSGAPQPDGPRPFPKNNDTGRTVGGLFLLVIGIYFLLNQFDFIPFWFSLDKLWPLIFVAIGASFILKSKRKNDWEEWKNQEAWKNEQKQAPSTAPVNHPTEDPTVVRKSTIDLNKDVENQSSTNNPI